jgi:hypothetical protein
VSKIRKAPVRKRKSRPVAVALCVGDQIRLRCGDGLLCEARIAGYTVEECVVVRGGLWRIVVDCSDMSFVMRAVGRS